MPRFHSVLETSAPGPCTACQKGEEDEEGDACAACGSFAHFKCIGIGLKISVNTLKLLHSPAIRILCPGCQGKPLPPPPSQPLTSSPGQDLDWANETEKAAVLDSITRKLDCICADQANLRATVDSISTFLNPVIPGTAAAQGGPRRSFASAAASRPSSSAPSIASAVRKAVEESTELALHRRSVVIAGLPFQDGEDLRAKIQGVVAATGLSDYVRLDAASRLPRPRRLASSSEPQLVKVSFLTPDMASTLLSASKDLAKSASHSNVYIRPSRTGEERLQLKERSQRLAQLRQEDPHHGYFINYRSSGFKIVRVKDGRPEWSWEDPGPPPPSTAPPAPLAASAPANSSQMDSPVLSQPAAATPAPRTSQGTGFQGV